MSYPLQLPSQLSSHLRALRKTKGLSQAALGKRLGLSQTRIARIEGDPLAISVEQLLAVLTALGVRVTLDPLSYAAPTPPAVVGKRAGSVRSATSSQAQTDDGKEDW